MPFIPDSDSDPVKRAVDDLLVRAGAAAAQLAGAPPESGEAFARIQAEASRGVDPATATAVVALLRFMRGADPRRFDSWALAGGVYSDQKAGILILAGGATGVAGLARPATGPARPRGTGGAGRAGNGSGKGRGRKGKGKAKGGKGKGRGRRDGNRGGRGPGRGGPRHPGGQDETAITPEFRASLLTEIGKVGQAAPLAGPSWAQRVMAAAGSANPPHLPHPPRPEPADEPADEPAKSGEPPADPADEPVESAESAEPVESSVEPAEAAEPAELAEMPANGSDSDAETDLLPLATLTGTWADEVLLARGAAE